MCGGVPMWPSPLHPLSSLLIQWCPHPLVSGPHHEDLLPPLTRRFVVTEETPVRETAVQFHTAFPCVCVSLPF